LALQFTTDQVLALAPDASSAKDARKLAIPTPWTELGQNSEALWGKCQGSGKDPYQVKIDLSTLTPQCSCPSRKIPCKHGLALLLFALTTTSHVPTAEPPAWVADWLTRRKAAFKSRETARTAQSDQPPTAAQLQRADKRLATVTNGLDQLDLWLNDLVRNGLATVEGQPITFWESHAKPLVDAQAPALATRLRRLASIPNASADWPTRLLAALGRIALLTHAFRRLDKLEPALQEDVRQFIGWKLEKDEVASRGETVTDDWMFLGQFIEEEDEEEGSARKAQRQRVRFERTWLLGKETGRSALILQTTFGLAPFPESYMPGMMQKADVIFWPSAYPQRALITTRQGELTSLKGHLTASTTVAAFLTQVASALARQPWLERFLCVLRDVTIIYTPQEQQWYLRDSNSDALPLKQGAYWKTLALSGGHPVDLAGEWDGETLHLLGVMIEDTYYVLSGKEQ